LATLNSERRSKEYMWFVSFADSDSRTPFPGLLQQFFQGLQQTVHGCSGLGTAMPTRTKFGHYSLVTAAAAVLVALVYLQFSNYLPDSMQLSGIKSLRQRHPACALAEVQPDHTLVAAAVWDGGIPSDLVIGTPPHAATIVRVSVPATSRSPCFSQAMA
jgi:hypothetical protein